MIKIRSGSVHSTGGSDPRNIPFAPPGDFGGKHKIPIPHIPGRDPRRELNDALFNAGKRAIGRIIFYKKIWDIGFDVGYYGALLYKHWRKSQELAEVPWTSYPPAWDNPGGAYNFCFCPTGPLGGPQVFVRQTNTSATGSGNNRCVVNACIGGQSVTILAPNTTQGGIWERRSTSPDRYRHIWSYRRRTGAPDPGVIPRYIPGRVVPLPADPFPMEAPWSDPAIQPWPQTRPQPQRVRPAPDSVPSPLRNPRPQRTPSPRPGRPPFPRPRAVPGDPDLRALPPWLLPRAPRYTDPSVDHPVPLPGEQRPPPPRPGVHVQAPASKGKNERKRKLGKGGLPGSLYGAATEAKDMADALANAMPPSYRWEYRKQEGLHNKVKYLARNWRHIDPRKAALNIAADQAEDRAVGIANKMGNRITKHPYWRGMRGVSPTRMSGGFPGPQF